MNLFGLAKARRNQHAAIQQPVDEAGRARFQIARHGGADDGVRGSNAIALQGAVQLLGMQWAAAETDEQQGQRATLKVVVELLHTIGMVPYWPQQRNLKSHA